QIVRTALGLAALTKKAFHVTNIRKGRTKPGLKKQHLETINALKTLCNAEVSDYELGSDELTFDPGTFKPQKLSIDIETAGSITLVLQSLLIPSIFSDKKTTLTIKGGTDVPGSMPFDYFRQILLPQLEKYAKIECNLIRRGYAPKGNGMIELGITPKDKSQQIILPEQEPLLAIKGSIHTSQNLLKRDVGERIRQSAEDALKVLKSPISITTSHSETLSDGCVITLWSVHGTEERDMRNPIQLGADMLGEIHMPAEDVGKLAAKNLIAEIKSEAAVDKHCADNLIPYLGLVGGKIKTSEITKHTLANIYVTEKFLNVVFIVNKSKNEISVIKPYLAQYQS
ncbi:MAG TPA: RNA 3'-terminal phosphate cyclase, partial [Candidatus Nanoarchaeia archaeon]|nr:RNA 3'-terminal phosphate cyclase [Candidatus Nanoarchaeia archaeon]